jgi:hypothetical protein
MVAEQEEVCEENGVAVTYSDTHYKPGAIDVLNQGSTTVIFTATQVFSDNTDGAWTSIVFKDENGNAVCQQKSDVPLGYSRSFKAQCDEGGFATVDVYVSSADWTAASYTNPDGEVCASWPDSKAELFSYKISCGACDGCSPPPDIEVPFNPDEVCEGDGVSVRYTDKSVYKPGAISILSQGTSEVIFTLKQVFNQASGGSLVSVVHQDTADNSWTCKESASPLAYNFQRSFKAACDPETGVATVDVYVHNPAWSSDLLNPRFTDRPGVCSSWPSDASPTGVALFSYELSCGVCVDCKPPPPTPPACPKENKLISMVGETMFPKWPIVIKSQNELSVTFEVEQTWSEKATIFTRFDHDVLGTSQCYQTTEVEKNSKQTYTALCLPKGKVTMVQIWVVDESFKPNVDIGVVPDCCYSGEAPEYPAVQYTFVLSCTPLCPEAERRRLRGKSPKVSQDL